MSALPSTEAANEKLFDSSQLLWKSGKMCLSKNLNWQLGNTIKRIVCPSSLGYFHPHDGWHSLGCLDVFLLLGRL